MKISRRWTRRVVAFTTREPALPICDLAATFATANLVKVGADTRYFKGVFDYRFITGRW